ncbi:MAG: TlyA family rRNA (cytidine-2'-O)-methyltransferase [Acidobacteriaceae bacterium]
MTKIRLDKLLTEGGYAASRERAQALILAGRVLVDEQRVDKPGAAVAPMAAIRLLGSDLRYVSRGGLKLEAALKHWGIEVGGLVGVDIGTSTGGFIDCMLQHGAAMVIGVDTGYGQVAESLRQDRRMLLHERTNARLLTPGALLKDLPKGAAAPAFLAMDVSFISATLVLPAVVGALSEAGQRWRGEAVILVKPQFEAGRENVGAGGIVRDPAAWAWSVERVRSCIRELGGEEIEVIDSPILGREGNREYLLHCRFRGE